MKILMVNKFLYPQGGAETYMFELARELETRGNEVQFFGMDSAERRVSNCLDAYVNEIDYQHASLMQKLSSPFKTIYSREAKKKLGAVIQAFAPDVVHLNNINFQLTPSVIYAAKQYGVPVVQTVHDVQIACPNHRMYIEAQERVCTECLQGGYTRCLKNKCIHNSTLQSAVAAAESLYYHKKNTYNLVDRYICPSHFVAQQIVKGGVEENRITVLPNYTPAMDNHIKTEKNPDRYLIYFGRISVEKGLKFLLDVMEELPEVTLLLAGTGPLEEELKERQPDNVKFVGFQSGKNLYNMIAGAVALIYPSQWYENCPMSVIEAIKLGTPVITSDIGGTKELIENGKNGIIYNTDDKASLKGAIEKLWNDTALADEMSQYCLAHGSTQQIETYAQVIEEIYRKLL